MAVLVDEDSKDVWEITRMEAEEMVEAGATWLTEQENGGLAWAWEVDVDKLDMNDPCKCMLGQLVKPETPHEIAYPYDFFDAVEGSLGKSSLRRRPVEEEYTGPHSMNMAEAFLRGFHLKLTLTEDDDGPSEFSDWSWILLRNAWQDKIFRIRAGDNS